MVSYMLTLSYTPTRIYNSSNKKPRNPESRPKKYQVVETVQLEQMRYQIARYKQSEKKIRLLTSWGLRATESSLSDLCGILETLDELYGEDAFDDEL